MPSSGPAAVLENVDFDYPGARTLIRDFSVAVERAGMAAVLGPNGSGKTTLIRLLAGRLAPLSGSVSVCGLDPVRCSRRELARHVAVVSQQSALGFPYTVAEVVLMGRAPHIEGFRLESTADLEVADWAMEVTRTGELASRRFDSLSSGERQRVTVARALVQEPEVLLLDEPAAHLDVKQTVLLYELLARLNRERGLTVVSVLHDFNLAALYFDKIILVKDGRPHAVGAPADVITYGTIREVFDTDVYVDVNSVTGQLNVLPLPLSRSAKPEGV